MKHSNRTTRQDHDRVQAVDPFTDSAIAQTGPVRKVASESSGYARDHILPKNGDAELNRNAKTPRNKRSSEHAKAENDPYGTRTRVTGVKGRCPNH